MACCYNPSSPIINLSSVLPLQNSRTHLLPNFQFTGRSVIDSISSNELFSRSRGFYITLCTLHCRRIDLSETESEHDTEEYEEIAEGKEEVLTVGNGHTSLPVRRRRLRRYRKQYPGEKNGISEEMRFVAMKLRVNRIKKEVAPTEANDEEGREKGENKDNYSEGNGSEENGETWKPTSEGFLKYLVDSELVFTTIERIVDESSDVSYVYFRKTGLERSDSLRRDIEWFSNMGSAIPEPSDLGVEYVQYLEGLAEKSPPLFLSHFYNIYFSHIAAGQVITKKVSKKLFEGRELEFSTWAGDPEDMLRGVREKLNALGEHWSRDEKNKCLKEATKAFRFLGRIVQLIVS